MSLIADQRDQLFVLHEMLGIESLFDTEKYQGLSRDVCDMTLELASKLGTEQVLPTFSKGDKQGAKFEDGEVTVPECYQALHEHMKASGLYTMHTSVEHGGQGFPYVMDIATREYSSFNLGFMLYPEAAIGAANLIATYGTDEQKRSYMEKMYAGDWGGTMVLTEPNAGSDVGALETKAVLQPDGTYRIKGNKIFISGGDSDLFENIVHPVLARIEGDPKGTGGISIFLVPKYLVNEDGTLGKRNDVQVTGIEDKMGLKGSATCAITFGENNECYAELLGDARTGMKIMFQMMNGARIGMGLQGLSTGSTAYLHALKYAKERIQGTDINRMRDPDASKVAIINHPDVRRMLIWMKSHVEGLRALVYFCAFADDQSKALDGEETGTWHGLVDLLVPIVKSYGTDIGFKITEQAIQVHGGYGYTKDFPVEQLMRDMKIASIYEGTNGIQALDLIGRKMSLNGGKPFADLIARIKETIASSASITTLKPLALEVEYAIKRVIECAEFFSRNVKDRQPQHAFIKASNFLELFGNTVLGWMHLWQAQLAVTSLEQTSESPLDIDNADALNNLAENANGDNCFYVGKLSSATYYIRNILPMTAALAETIQNKDESVLLMPEAAFGDGV